MALLPLAGWAQGTSIANYEIEILLSNFSYSAAAPVITPTVHQPNVQTALVQGTDYELVYYSTTSETPLAAAPKAVGTYRVGAHGIGSYTGYTSTKVTYNITPKNLADTHVVGQEDVADLTVGAFDYTACRTTEPNSATYDGEKWEPTLASVTLYGFAANQFVENEDYELEYGENINAGLANNNAGGSVTIKAKGTNFTGSKTVYFDIAKADIPQATITAATPTAIASLVYNGKEQALIETKTLDSKYGTLEYALGANPADADWATAAPKAKTANPTTGYVVKWRITGSNNYNDVAAAALANNVTIAKKDATLKLSLKEEVYDGQDGDPSAVKINYGGLASSDVKASLTNFAGMVHVEFFTNNNFGNENDDNSADDQVVAEADYNGNYTNVGTYLVKAIIDENDGEQEPTANPFFENYNITSDESDYRGEYYKIAGRPITFKARDIEFDYGTNPAMPAAVTVDDNTADPAVVGTIELTAGSFAEGEDFDDISTDFSFAWSEAYQGEAKTLEGALVLNVKEIGAQVNPRSDAGSNYIITTVAGDIKFRKTLMTVYVNSFEKEYGETIDAENDFSYDAPEALKEGTEVYTVWDEDGNEQIEDFATKTLTPGVYMIKLTAEALDNGERKVDANSFQPGYVVITEKEITIDMSGKTVTVNQKADKATLQQYVSQEDFASQLEDQLVGDDEINYEIIFNTDGQGAVEIDQTGKLISAVGPYNAGYTGYAFTENDDDVEVKQNAYYVITFVPGKLVVNEENTLILDEDDAELATRIADAAALCATSTQQNPITYAVTFKRANLTGGFWNAMVLPFETTVREVSNALGYAVVDMLETSTDGDAHFKIAFGTIPANTPFMVKTDADVVFDGVAQVGNPGDANYVAPQAQVKFTKKTIETTNIVDDFHGSQALFDDGHNKFYGIYTPYTLAANNTTERMLGRATAAEKDNSWQIFQGYAVKNTRGILILEKNLSARIFIEEPDGSTTVINSIDADGVAMPAEGWYTLNGVKLQSMPTEKGIYINNGKKVVIK